MRQRDLAHTQVRPANTSGPAEQSRESEDLGNRSKGDWGKLGIFIYLFIFFRPIDDVT